MKGSEEYCSRSGAQRLKEQIEQYWRQRGHDVYVYLQEAGFHPVVRLARYDVRSTLVNGLPPRGMA